MKATRICLLSTALLTAWAASPKAAFAQAVDVARTPTWDVLELQDGSLYKGVIVEQSPGQSYKLAMIDGSIRVFAADQVIKISKEANPYAAPRPAPAPAAAPTTSTWSGGSQTPPASKGLSAPHATTGLRFGVDAIIAFPTGNWADGDAVKTSFAPSLRFGYESIKGNFGIGGGIQTRFIPWLLDSEWQDQDVSSWLLEAHAYGRASLHMGKFAPYAGMSMGLDSAQLNGPGSGDDINETGFGMALDFGFDAFVSDSIAIGLGASAKLTGPEFDDDFAPKYFGLRLGMTTHF